MQKKTLFSLAALSVMGMTNIASAAKNNDHCAPEPAAPCYSDSCACTHCLGPDQVNPSVRPLTCNGDLRITLAGFYWSSHQDGMEYAVESQVTFDPSAADEVTVLNNLIDAEFKTPKFDWDFGFRLGLGYNSNHDGWDVGVMWTWYNGKANSHNEAETDDNHVLIPINSAFNAVQGGNLWATDIETNWKLQLNLVDIELGREFWTSRYLTLRPFVGVRIAWIDQDYTLQHKGGAWTDGVGTSGTAQNNKVKLDNDFRGAGLRAGLDSVWNLGCGWAIFGNLAFDLVYGRFNTKLDEDNREVSGSHTKTEIAEVKSSFRAARAMADLALGVQWSTLFCAGEYGFTAMLGWEQHLFFDQNQMWRVVRIGGSSSDGLPNLNGENVFQQRRGDLDTQGWTLTFKFDF